MAEIKLLALDLTEPSSTGRSRSPPHPGGPGPGTAAGGAGGARHRAALPGDPPGGAGPAGAAVRGELQRGHHPGPGHGTGAAGKLLPAATCLEVLDRCAQVPMLREVFRAGWGTSQGGL